MPTNFQYLVDLFAGDRRSNQIWSLDNSAKRWTVGDSFDVSGVIKNALPFASARDPRVAVTGTGTKKVGVFRRDEPGLHHVFARTDPVPLVSGVDAR